MEVEFLTKVQLVAVQLELLAIPPWLEKLPTKLQLVTVQSPPPVTPPSEAAELFVKLQFFAIHVE